VAFDVYKAIGGSERTRVLTMNVITFTFIVGMSLQAVISLLGDRDTYRPSKLLPSLRRLRRSPFLRREVWEQLRDYNRPDFHPDDRDTSELIARWRDELFGDQGTLNDKLASNAAA
jgi:predicted metal-dependent hydrolase